MNFLFICSQNRWRSPTAENIFSHQYGVNTRSAGTSKKARIKVNKQDINWADIIFVMEKKHKDYLSKNFEKKIENKPIKVLHIKDKYQYMDEQLIDQLRQKINPFLPT